jgi:putative FmdB family regulatory protein
MPLYEYRCARCDSVFEVIQKFSDTPLTTHEGCGGSVERLISAPGLQFKGSGWYITDYARNSGGPEKAKSEDSGDKKTAESKGESKSESKTESKDAKPSPSGAKQA